MKEFRVRFAPSPTGPLHIGGVRTALYNYLLAKKHNGKFILRIEDTDQNRYIPDAEEYIINSLNWFGLVPDEGPGFGGQYGPYRQSERKPLYAKLARELVAADKAYYAFDSSEDLDNMRQQRQIEGVHSPKYDGTVRNTMKNSLTLSKEEVDEYLSKGENVTIRLKIPQDEVVEFEDLIRGSVRFSSNELDDKILLKADGMPTYHLANIIDDKHMKISHVIRGEEWLSSTAHHVLLYRAFGWVDEMPQFAHLPLILKPRGKGKLSKRDGQKFGFPVFPISWSGNDESENFMGFKEEGYLPDAVLNFLVLLGWNPGTEQEIFDIEELISEFSISKIVRSGARFDIDKARWFNQQYIMKTDDENLLSLLRPLFAKAGIERSDDFILRVCKLMKERAVGLQDFIQEAPYLYHAPELQTNKIIRKKYSREIKIHLQQLIQSLANAKSFAAVSVQTTIKSYIEEKELRFGDLMPLLRISITGSLKGPDLFDLMALIGQEECLERMKSALDFFDKSITSEINS